MPRIGGSHDKNWGRSSEDLGAITKRDWDSQKKNWCSCKNTVRQSQNSNKTQCGIHRKSSGIWRTQRPIHQLKGPAWAVQSFPSVLFPTPDPQPQILPQVRAAFFEDVEMQDMLEHQVTAPH